jgi:hypothetical protein
VIDVAVPFENKQDVIKRSIGKKIILFGAGNIAEKTSRIFDSTQILCIIDNSINLHGNKQLGVEVKDPVYLESINKNEVFILICSTSFVEISDQLNSQGFTAQRHYAVSPILNDLRIIEEMETINQQLLFTSGAPARPGEKFGGGVYALDICGENWECNKIIDGNCYGMIPFEDNFIAIDTDIGIFEFDKNLNILRSSKLPNHSRAHGVAYNKNNSSFYITCSYLDSVLVLDKEFNHKDIINLSNKNNLGNPPNHHCNDCFIHNNSLYISMFSISGNWKIDVFDGGILEVDTITNKVIGQLTSDLWMPHNVKIINGGMYVLDSLKGQLKGNNFQVIGDFPAFTRGLTHDKNYFYVGQSRNRNYSRNLGLSKNISIDAGIVIFDEVTKVSRFVQVSPKISEIHSIVIRN